MITKKKEYEKPSMQVFIFKQQLQLLEESTLQDYNWNDPEQE